MILFPYVTKQLRICCIIAQHIEVKKNGPHLADSIFKLIFLQENGGIRIQISLKFIPKVPINDTQALV